MSFLYKIIKFPGFFRKFKSEFAKITYLDFSFKFSLGWDLVWSTMQKASTASSFLLCLDPIPSVYYSCGRAEMRKKN